MARQVLRGAPPKILRAGRAAMRPRAGRKFEDVHEATRSGKRAGQNSPRANAHHALRPLRVAPPAECAGRAARAAFGADLR